MSDEFDDEPGRPAARAGARRWRRSDKAPRLVGRLYASAAPGLRSRMLACLLRPLGILGVAGAAAGAFAHALHRSEADTGIALDAARYSADQVRELTHFVEQVDPQVLQQLVGLLSESSFGVAAFSAAALALLHRIATRPRE